MVKDRNIPVGDNGGLPGSPGVYLYLISNTFFASERFKFEIIFLRLALLFLFICAFPKTNEIIGGQINFSTA